MHPWAIALAGAVLWVVPFALVRARQKAPVTLDRGARWGVLLEGAGYTTLWQGSFWTRPAMPWQTAVAIASFAAACALSWTAVPALGRYHRLDAALQSDHELIRSGPYRFVRHPIYTSMLCVLLGTGTLISPWYLLVPGLVLFLIGTEIRMGIEDRLLASRFGGGFEQYRRAVPRLIPFLKWWPCQSD